MKPVAAALLKWYAQAGRAELPWRATRDPYPIIVSEFMLQQTQVERARPVYERFLKRFPTIAALATAPLSDVLREWKGMGYNSRAVRLQQLAKAVVEVHGGRIPSDPDALRALAGIGSYTSAALRAFAFDADVTAFDTNVRRVIHRAFIGLEFPSGASVRELEQVAAEQLPSGRGHDWNSALMDLGARVCTARSPRCVQCPLQQFCSAAPVDAARLETLRAQSAAKKSPQERLAFEQTTRFARGRVVDRLRELPPGKAISLLDLERDLQGVVGGGTGERIRVALGTLERDGIVARRGESFALRD